MRRTIVIGDVHGCIEELKELLKKCDFCSDDDVVFVGDLIARGPDSKGVLELVRRMGARSVLGNHDHALLSWKKAVNSRNNPPLLNGALLSLTNIFSEEDWAFLDSLPYFIRLPDYNAVVVHAGLIPGIDLESQEPHILLNIRTIRPDGKGSDKALDGPPWGSLWPGPEKVIFGHHARRGLQQHPYAIGLDTGCVYGRSLTAYLLPECQLVSVKAKRAYYLK